MGMFVYLLTNRKNGKRYVGQTINRVAERVRQHKYVAKRSNNPLASAIRKYGWDAFDTEVLEECIDEADLDMAERFWIRCYGSQVPDGYNLESGGAKRKRVAEATKYRLKTRFSGEGASNRKLTWEIVRTIRARAKGGESGASLSREYGVSRMCVSHILADITWRE